MANLGNFTPFFLDAKHTLEDCNDSGYNNRGGGKEGVLCFFCSLLCNTAKKVLFFFVVFHGFANIFNIWERPRKTPP